jgi:hypothetical protein
MDYDTYVTTETYRIQEKERKAKIQHSKEKAPCMEGTSSNAPTNVGLEIPSPNSSYRDQSDNFSHVTIPQNVHVHGSRSHDTASLC